ncbi:MAG: PSD1 domain-containing protein [Chitinophagaceae bacterium]|nr:PSD1 domain-containing protein [Chitinophagaceae bacterium]
MLKTNFLLSLFLFGGIVWMASCMSGNSSSGNLPETVSYNFHIRPIFSDKCFKCHGPDPLQRKAGLRLDIGDSAFVPLKETKGAFALVPGNPGESELYKRVASTDTSYQMPTPDSHLGTLTEYEVALVKKWIQQGAKYEKHWAFSPAEKATPPSVSDEKWVKNEIDRFVLHRLDDMGLKPNEEADKERLLKRVSLDITGLPPSESLMESFLKDAAPNAYDKVVDQLLAQPQYGEKLAIQWMDLARYADSYGYQDDNIRTQWPWRDWVIHAFNENLPYDQFLTWQLAGDMLPNANKEQQLATAFFRNHKYTEEGGVIEEEYRIEYLLDKTKTFGKGILGLSIECAQCHDHKYDPFSQKDYYQMLAFFNNTKEIGFEGDVSVSKPAKNPLMSITDADKKALLSFVNMQDTSALTVSVMGELQDTVRKTFILNRGVYNQPTVEVQPAVLPAVLKYEEASYPKNRIGLAKWTTDKKNPLTARVFVNRLWQDIFGRGIVKTTGDFGMQGDLPSHPELLDWLAADFMENGWDIKRLIKQIVSSATYRQSVKTDELKLKKDPENVYFSRGPRVRVKAEEVRDIVLATSGLLNKTIGGPSVKPYQTKGLWEAATSGRGVLATYKQDHGDALYRRGLYTFIKLTVPPPALMLFDGSNRDQCEVRRSKTNTPLQALMMLNDPTVLEASRVLSQTLLQQGLSSDDAIKKAFHRIICRNITEKEQKILVAYYNEQLQLFTDKKLDAALTLKAGEYPAAENLDINKSAALMKVISAIYNLEEAITKS